MYELQFIKIPKPFKKNIDVKTRYDLGEANRRYVETAQDHQVEGERLEINLLDVSTNEAYQLDLYTDLESDLLELIIKHLSESIGALDEKDAEKVEVIKQKIMDDFMIENVESANEEVFVSKNIVETPKSQQVSDALTEDSKERVAPPLPFNDEEIEGAVDLAEYLDATDFLALVKLKKLQAKVDEKINWSAEELFGFFSFINSEEMSSEKRNETLLTYDFSVDLKHLKAEIATLIEGLEQQAQEGLELRYQQSLEDTEALLTATEHARRKVLLKQLRINEKHFRSELEQDFAMEADQLKEKQEQEVQRLIKKHEDEASQLVAHQKTVLQTSCDNFNEERMVMLNKALANHVKTELVNIQASQKEELQHYKKLLNQEQLTNSSGRIERLQMGERKIVETLFNVLKFNVLKQEDPTFQEDYDPYSEQEFSTLRNQIGSEPDQKTKEMPPHQKTPPSKPTLNQKVAEPAPQAAPPQRQQPEPKLTTPTVAKTSGTTPQKGGSKKWWISGGIVLLIGIGATTVLLQNQTPEEPSGGEQQPPIEEANEVQEVQDFQTLLATREYVDAIRNHPEYAPELVSHLFEREDADNLREVLELQVVETLHGLLNLAILEGQYEVVVYEFERLAIEDRQELNSQQQAGVLHAYDVLGIEPADF